jgi:hypothetical protein
MTAQENVRLYLYQNTINVLQIKKDADNLEIAISDNSKIVFENNSISLYSKSRSEMNSIIKRPMFHKFIFDGKYYRCILYPEKTLSEGYLTYFMRDKYILCFRNGTEHLKNMRIIIFNENF